MLLALGLPSPHVEGVPSAVGRCRVTSRPFLEWRSGRRTPTSPASPSQRGHRAAREECFLLADDFSWADEARGMHAAPPQLSTLGASLVIGGGGGPMVTVLGGSGGFTPWINCGRHVFSGVCPANPIGGPLASQKI